MTVPFWTRCGAIDLTALRPEDLTAEALGDALAKINRFGGRTSEPWSVAAHSVLVEALCPPDLKPWALLHDVHKAFLGDLMDPAMELICLSGTRPAVEHAVQNAEARLDRAIAAGWGVVPRSRSEGLLQACQAAFLAEIWAFMGIAPGHLHPAAADLLDRAMSYLREFPAAYGDWRAARALWLGRVEFLASAGQLAPPRRPDPSSAVLAG